MCKNVWLLYMHLVCVSGACLQKKVLDPPRTQTSVIYHVVLSPKPGSSAGTARITEPLPSSETSFIFNVYC